MDCLKAIKQYLDDILSRKNGMSIVLLDDDTTPVMSTALTQSNLLSHEVYLVDKISNPTRERLRHLKCICLLRPSSESVGYLERELKDPKYGEYAIYFTNITPKSTLERLAEADESECVVSMMEYYADFIAVDKCVYSLDTRKGSSRHTSSPQAGPRQEMFREPAAGIVSILLALKKRPRLRYEGNSTLARKIASEVQFTMESESTLFDFRRTDTDPILLISDRKNDPVTPLLTQWTYQAMIHEMIGIENGRIDLKDHSNVKPELRQMVMSSDNDAFFRENMHLNFGDLGANVKDFVSQFQARTRNNQSIQSINDMKRFIEEYPEFRKLSGNVSKHVTLISELSRIVEENNLLAISEVEQSLACTQSHATDLKNVQDLLQSRISDDAKVRLVCLYALRYENTTDNSLPLLKDLLKANGVRPNDISCIDRLLQYAGNKQRLVNIFGNTARTIIGFKGLKGVENVYTQHQPALEATIQQLLRGKLSERSFPYLDGKSSSKDKPQDVIIFFVGGITYEEAKLCHELQNQTPEIRLVIGGSTILNSKSFLDVYLARARVELTETAIPLSESKTKPSASSPAIISS